MSHHFVVCYGKLFVLFKELIDRCRTLSVSQIPSHLQLRMERCWATPTSDPYSNIHYTFIADRSASGLFKLNADENA